MRPEAWGWVGKRIATFADGKWGPGNWNQAKIARECGYSEDAISQAMQADRLPPRSALPLALGELFDAHPSSLNPDSDRQPKSA